MAILSCVPIDLAFSSKQISANELSKPRPTAASLAAGGSPCIDVCGIDPSRRCVGCGRTLEQIGAWSRMTDAERAEVNANLPQSIRENLLGDANPPVRFD